MANRSGNSTTLDDFPEEVVLDPFQEPKPTEHHANPRARMIWRLIFAAIPLSFIVFLGWRLVQTNVWEQRASGVAPDFVFTSFEGETIALADLKGQGVVVNFWASWCDPCREEADMLEQTWRRERGNGIVFLGIDYMDQEPAALAYLAEFDITYPNGPDLQNQIARRYSIRGVPETFFIGPDGAIVDVVIGPILNQRQLDGLLDRIRP